jgi:hypothetical protein
VALPGAYASTSIMLWVIEARKPPPDGKVIVLEKDIN